MITKKKKNYFIPTLKCFTLMKKDTALYSYCMCMHTHICLDAIAIVKINLQTNVLHLINVTSV